MAAVPPGQARTCSMPVALRTPLAGCIEALQIQLGDALARLLGQCAELELQELLQNAAPPFEQPLCLSFGPFL
jgi:hypothetical protein